MIPASPAPHILHLAERCPGSPHPFDVITLRKHASLEMGVAMGAVGEAAGGDEPRLQAGFAREMLRWGIEAWTFIDENGRVPVHEPIERSVLDRWLPFEDGGLEVIEAATALYGDDVLAPFVRRYLPRSPAGLADHLTSARNGSGPSPAKRSKRSSHPGTAGKRSGGRGR